MNFLYFAVIALLPSCFAVVLPDLEKHAIEEQLAGLEHATLNDFKHQLDLVECPLAIPRDQSLITYQTSVYYAISSASFYCCSWRLRSNTKPLALQEDNTVAVGTDGQLRGAIQHFKLSCPRGGRIMQETFIVDLLPPVQYRGETLCPDSVSFVFNNDNSRSCQFCGDKISIGDSSTCTMARFMELLVTFRSGYRPTNGHMGFNLTVMCNSALQSVQEQTVHRQQASSCIEYDPKIISEQYLQNLQPMNFQTEDDERDLEADLQLLLKKIPIDAESTLLQLHDGKLSSLPADRILRMLNLALLCEQSCDAKLATLSKDVQALFPQETIVRAGLFIA